MRTNWGSIEARNPVYKGEALFVPMRTGTMGKYWGTTEAHKARELRKAERLERKAEAKLRNTGTAIGMEWDAVNQQMKPVFAYE